MRITYLAMLNTSVARGLLTSRSRVDELWRLGEMFTSSSHGFSFESRRMSKPKSSKQEYLLATLVWCRLTRLLSALSTVLIIRSLIFSQMTE